MEDLVVETPRQVRKVLNDNSEAALTTGLLPGAYHVCLWPISDLSDRLLDVRC